MRRTCNGKWVSVFPHAGQALSASPVSFSIACCLFTCHVSVLLVFVWTCVTLRAHLMRHLYRTTYVPDAACETDAYPYDMACTRHVTRRGAVFDRVHFMRDTVHRVRFMRPGMRPIIRFSILQTIFIRCAFYLKNRKTERKRVNVFQKRGGTYGNIVYGRKNPCYT